MNFMSFKKKTLLATAALMISTVAGEQAMAKDLTSRLGVGFRNSYSIDIPSIAATYYPSSEFGVVGAIGIDTEKDAARSVFMGGLRRIVFKEEQMNFYMGGNLAMLSQELSNETNSGFEIAGVVGGEFFFQGLDSLGLSFETGVAMSNVKKVRFRTLADSPFRAGITFYF